MAISKQEYLRRYAAIRGIMKNEALDAILVVGISDDFNRGNIRYIAGTGRGGVCIFPPEGKPVMLAAPNALASPKMPRTMEAFDLLDIRETPNNIEQALKELARFDKGGKIGLVGLACMPVPLYLAVKEKFGSRLADMPLLFEPLRVIKSAEEIEKTRAAAVIADKVYARLRKIIKPGLSEYSIYGEVKKIIYEEGCEYGFDLVDGSGSTMNMAFFPTTDKLEKNGTLFMEISPSFQGYYAQLPVTLPVVAYRPDIKEMVKAWVAADEAVHKILRPGTKVSDIYKILISTIESNGFKSPLRPGHSIGLDILDYWSITDTDNREIKAGMCLAIHPCVLTKPGGDGCGMGYTYLITEAG